MGVVFADGSSLQKELKSGVVLCQLCNAIRPGVCAEPSTMSEPSEEARMETLACYFTSCDVIGVPKERQLKTATLYRKNNWPTSGTRRKILRAAWRPNSAPFPGGCTLREPRYDAQVLNHPCWRSAESRSTSTDN